MYNTTIFEKLYFLPLFVTFEVTALVGKQCFLKNSNELCLFIYWSNFRTAEIGQTLILVKKDLIQQTLTSTLIIFQVLWGKLKYTNIFTVIAKSCYSLYKTSVLWTPLLQLHCRNLVLQQQYWQPINPPAGGIFGDALFYSFQGPRFKKCDSSLRRVGSKSFRLK